MENLSTDKYPRFEDYFSELVQTLDRIPEMEEEIKAEFDPPVISDLYKRLQTDVVEKQAEIFDKILGEEYQECIKYGNTFKHWIVALYNSYSDKRYQKLKEEHQNQILWASFMHDLGKRGDPILSGKDHIHPFRSAAFALRVFVRNNFISEEFHEEALGLAEFVLNANVEITCKKYLKRNK